MKPIPPSGPLAIVLNPSSGSRTATKFLETVLEPFLARLDVPFRVYETLAENDGERIGTLLREQWQQDGSAHSRPFVDVVVLGGDGTAHGENQPRLMDDLTLTT